MSLNSETSEISVVYFPRRGAWLQGEDDVVFLGHAAHVQDGVAHASQGCVNAKELNAIFLTTIFFKPY